MGTPPNNITITILLIAYFSVLSGCKKTPEKIESTPSPVETPTPIPIPEQAVWTPKVGDQVFVAEKFSIEIEDGNIGFPVGKKVSILAINGEDFVVSDGKTQVSKPARFFIDTKPVASTTTPRPTSITPQPNHQLIGLEHELAKKESLLKKYENGIFQINQKIKNEDLDSRIEKAKQERLNKGFPPNGGPRSRRNGTIVSLSKDASNIEALILKWNAYMDQIKEYENQIPSIKGEINQIKKEIRDIKNKN